MGLARGLRNAFTEAATNPKLGRQRRTLQGPLLDPQKLPNASPNDPVMPTREEAVLSGSSRYRNPDGELMQLRNRGSVYSPLGKTKTVARRRQEMRKVQPVRNKKAEQQTEGPGHFDEGRPEDLKDTITNELTEAHHRAGLDIYNLVFEGLDETGSSRMRAYLRELGVAGGDSIFNRMDLPVDIHRALHAYAIERGYQYFGKNKNTRIEGFEKLNVYERKQIVKDFVEYAQTALDQETYRLMSQRGR
jgi:hypothetical protein